ncbi:tetratricopeptide repeat protein (macronuclear) [Tetrahymena thermophila SB210]|uniref:Tetratricopeptide repeat protein n=1 Tax=Tetrahymena thermophila (strain SB210) TaxID=312017 RepID=Q22KN4_TETTS|nr:tetratricopeptide repeat protein [Tetrahymena thermophila SB210]EAR85765.2 tetratricopeptide repeat protein [Tetrahymena thermophila SB210]|eukprot:XP_001033428.2 tetratricopeptide repeat protein [Tetrahymena thermophila SB210]
MQKFLKSAQIDEIKIIEQVQDSFYQCRLKELIQLIDQVDVNRSLVCHEILQLFKGMSLFKSQQIKMGFQCFEDIIQEIHHRKKIFEEIDLTIWCIYQLQAQYYLIQKAEAQNERFYQFMQDFLEQHQQLDSYQMGVFQFAKGMYVYIDTFREGLDKQCLSLLEQSYELVEDFKIEILICLGWIYYKDKQFDKACYYYQILYNQNPKIPSVANNYAIALECCKEFEKAEQLYLEEEKMRGYNQGIISNIALFYSHRGNKEKEFEYYQKLIQLTPLTGKICHYYGDYLIKRGDQEEGIKYMKRGIEIDPDYYGNYDQLSEIQFNNQNWNESLQYTLKCTQIFPQDGYYQTLLGDRYDALDDFLNAKKCYKKGIKLKNYQIYKLHSSSKLGICYYSLNKQIKSIEQFFMACNFKSIEGYSIEDVIYISCQIMELMPLQQIIEIIEKQQGLHLISRFSQFAELSMILSIKQHFLQKLEIHRQVLSLIIYKKFIVNHLMFQSEIIHWDLFID